MTLPASGPLSLAQIQGEFGGTGSIFLSEYYAGGGLVPSGTIGYPGGTPTAIPSSGTISVANFYGSTAVLPQPAPYQFIRFSVSVDRITVYRLDVYTGAVSVVSSTSGQSIETTLPRGLTDSTNLALSTPIGPSATLSTGTVYRGSWIQPDTFGQTYVSIVHQPTAAEPYVDVRVDDDGPPTAIFMEMLLTVQLGSGATAPVVSSAPYFYAAYVAMTVFSGGAPKTNCMAYNLLPNTAYTLTATSNRGSVPYPPINNVVTTNANGELLFITENVYEASSNWFFNYTITGNGANLSLGPYGPFDFTPSGGGGD